MSKGIAILTSENVSLLGNSWILWFITFLEGLVFFLHEFPCTKSRRLCEKCRFLLSSFEDHVICAHCRLAAGLCDVCNPCEVCENESREKWKLIRHSIMDALNRVLADGHTHWLDTCHHLCESRAPSPPPPGE